MESENKTNINIQITVHAVGGKWGNKKLTCVSGIDLVPSIYIRQKIYHLVCGL